MFSKQGFKEDSPDYQGHPIQEHLESNELSISEDDVVNQPKLSSNIQDSHHVRVGESSQLRPIHTPVKEMVETEVERHQTS